MSNSLSTIDIRFSTSRKHGRHPQLEYLAPARGLPAFLLDLRPGRIASALPFDLPEGKEELVGPDTRTEYFGHFEFALFYLGSYINLVLSASVGWRCLLSRRLGASRSVEWLAGAIGQSVDALSLQVITGLAGYRH